MAGELAAVTSSMTTAATTMHGLAKDLQLEQFDPGLADAAGDPASHPDVAAALRAFGGFAGDQYRDAVALLSALSTGVRSSATGYDQTEYDNQQKIATFLTESVYEPPE